MVAIPKEQYERLITSAQMSAEGVGGDVAEAKNLSAEVNESKIAHVNVREGGTVLIDQAGPKEREQSQAAPNDRRGPEKDRATAKNDAPASAPSSRKTGQQGTSSIRPRFFVGTKEQQSKAALPAKQGEKEPSVGSKVEETNTPFLTRADGRPLAKAMRRKVNLRKRKTEDDQRDEVLSKRAKREAMRRQMDMFVQRRLDQLHGRRRMPDYFRPLGPVVPEPMDVPAGTSEAPASSTTPMWRQRLMEEMEKDQRVKKPTMMEVDRRSWKPAVKRKEIAEDELRDQIPFKRGKEDLEKESSAKVARMQAYDDSFY